MNEKKTLPYVHLTNNLKESYFYFGRFMEAYTHFTDTNIESIRKCYPYKITFKDGTCIYFMSNSYYAKWCIGRTYRIWGVKKKIYRSGYEL